MQSAFKFGAISQVAAVQMVPVFNFQIVQHVHISNVHNVQMFKFGANCQVAAVQMVPVFKFAGRPVQVPFETIGGGEKAVIWTICLIARFVLNIMAAFYSTLFLDLEYKLERSRNYFVEKLVKPVR